jgi:hypothetical protein
MRQIHHPARHRRQAATRRGRGNCINHLDCSSATDSLLIRSDFSLAMAIPKTLFSGPRLQ